MAHHIKPQWIRPGLYEETDLACELFSTRRRDIGGWVAEEAVQFIRSTRESPRAEELSPLSPEAETDWVITTSGWDPDEIEWGTAEPAEDRCPELKEILQLGYRAGKRGHGDRYLDGLIEFLRSSFERGADAGCCDED